MEDKYYHTKESVEEYIKHSEGYSGKDLINKLNEVLKSGSSILELGSGPGKDWTIFTELGFEVIGSDYSEEFVSYLKKTFTSGSFLRLDASKLEVNQKFDAIYSNKVLHHLTDLELKNSIDKQVELLNTDGIICHSFWKGEGDEEFKGMYVNYHTKKEIETLVSKRFEILALEEYAEFEANDSLFLIGRKK